MIFTDIITIYTYNQETEAWDRKVVKGVQWSDQFEKQDSGGKLSVSRYAKITFPVGTFEDLILEPTNEENAIIYGEIEDEVTATKGSRLSDLLNKYPRSGRLKSVNDNSNRPFLKNIKVVIA